ncbi:insulin-degrading enzyme-like [Pollicipes pollicipes]|uniref:insulin-degrading enzyme-like n=1 Tax=Pollicipes pollicipes TaxID=41117 RepID=UPI001884B2E5|nr:insulin-degrading enzyme-like [Pollicipes pollicipes]XP_037080310.1 insulin-degrading enzyme-like [Pollicipes pollicipes]XP_037080311.1 insulin-degrading enzyme-like [Pollicipes pollicipes]
MLRAVGGLSAPGRRLASTLAMGSVVQRCDNIRQSTEDRRKHRGLVLSNNLRVLLVSDPLADKAAASMAVQVGHLSDPDDLEGLAHFCEHMLFMGTEKYPDENEYSKFLNDHGGTSNAYTSNDETNYHFEVAPEHFKGALDRFAQFFISPLFAEGSTEREVNAVHSEHEKNVANDTWRLMQVDRTTSRAGHPHRKFSTGSRETLDRPDVRERLLQFHQQWYSANIMGLVLVGKEELDVLEAMAVDLFSAVEDKGVEAPSWPEHPCGPEQIGTCLRVTPVKDLRKLKLHFPVPDLHPWYRTNPGHYVGHLVGHEGPGSLYAELKRLGWATSLVGGPSGPVRGYQYMYVSIDLTEEGERRVGEVADHVFQYLALLRQEGPQQWVFDEGRRLREMSFRFKDKEKPSDYATNLATLLYYYPMAEVLSADYITDKYDPDVLKMVTDKMTPDNVRMTLLGKAYEAECDVTERWYGTRYSVQKIPPETLQRWRTLEPNPNLHLPEPNEFIPEDFELVERDQAAHNAPVMLANTPLCRVWFKQDDTFKLPKSIVKVELFNPVAYSDPHMVNVTHMFTMLFKDALNDYAYAASVAGVRYNLGVSRRGMMLEVGGFSHKLDVLLRKIMDSMVSFRVDRARFDVLKEAYLRSLRNFAAEQPYLHATHKMNVVLVEKYWEHDALLEAVDELTVEAVERLLPLLLSKLHLECLLEGNLTRGRALELVSLVESRLRDGFSVRPIPAALQILDRETMLDDGKYYTVQKQNDVHKSSSIDVYYQCGLQSVRDNTLLDLLVQILNEPCFDQLRTKEQLGYIVWCTVRRSTSTQGLRVIVQSDKPPEYVDMRIEAFLHSMADHLRQMSAEEFANHKEALETRKLEKPKNLADEFTRHWDEIVIRQYYFGRERDEVEQLKTIERDELVKFFEAHVCHTAPGRRKLAAHVLSSQCTDTCPCLPDGLCAPPDYQAGEAVLNVPAFKALHGHFPHVAPAVDVSVTPPQAKL